ncbi:hypothetical protein ABK040_016367 [Willaertia magna]
MNEVTVSKVEKMSNYEIIDYQLNVLNKLQKETKELLLNQQSIQNLHQFEIINLKEKEMNKMINQIGKINQSKICPKFCKLIYKNFKENDTFYCNDILKFKIQLKDYNNEIIQLDNKLLTSYSLQCYLKEIDSDNKLIELQKEINENNYNIEITIPEIENDKKVELIVLINNYQITKLSLNIIVTKYEWDNNYLLNAQLLNKNKSIKKIHSGNTWNSYKLTPIIKLTNNNIQEFKFKINRESYYTFIGICDLTNQFNHNNGCAVGSNFVNNLEYSFASHSSLTCIHVKNKGNVVKTFDNVNFKTGDIIIIQLKRGQFILINETRFISQPCVCDIPQEMESVYLVVSLYQKDSQITLIN